MAQQQTLFKSHAVESTSSDKETGSSSPDPAADHGTVLAIDPAIERALVWKFDLRILPVLAIMYLFNSLDKSNLGNAKTAGLEKTLGLKGDQYNIILSVFFVPYVLTAPFLSIAGKKYGPNRVLPLMMLSFGLWLLHASGDCDREFWRPDGSEMVSGHE